MSVLLHGERIGNNRTAEVQYPQVYLSKPIALGLPDRENREHAILVILRGVPRMPRQYNCASYIHVTGVAQ